MMMMIVRNGCVDKLAKMEVYRVIGAPEGRRCQLSFESDNEGQYQPLAHGMVMIVTKV